jgi:cellulose synthase/poly-beta-1,6-N-acetylglucosamine synthase-like glycosyltransferase
MQELVADGPAGGRAEAAVRGWWRGVAVDEPLREKSVSPPRPGPCPEIDCVRHLLAAGVAEAAEQRSLKVGVGADRVLVTAGRITDETYLAALASALRISFESLEEIERSACGLSDDRLIEGARFGLLPLHVGGELVWIVAPRGLTARKLTELMRTQPDLASRIRLTTDQHLQSFASRCSRAAIAQRAVHRLSAIAPALSAAPRRRNAPRKILNGLLLGGTVLALPGDIIGILGFLSALVFLAWILFRLVGVVVPAPMQRLGRRLPDDRLPVYSVLVPLYREMRSLPGLVRALQRLDYPPEKLDIKLVLEADDRATRAAVDRLQLTAPFQVVIAPPSGPRTKPKALNAALLAARGTFVTIYDAEDRPEPEQLRIALDAFLAGDDDLACVQARLTIDNTEDGWLARVFTAEYAGLFDVFLPVIAARRLPIPLGGSSNHFRTAVLRRVGGWDPFNVTEDADLGIRLARFGYRTTVIASTTYEEAPARLDAWLKQRTRWFKGWVQTWRVHMRSPRRLLRDLGLSGFVGFQLVVGGTVLAALVHPIFLALMASALMSGSLTGYGQDTAGRFLVALAATTFVGGYLVSGLLGYVGLARRNLHASGWALVWMPVHWALLSVAAWRALAQLARDPYRWDKTEHGLARHSRLAQSAPDRRRASQIAAQIGGGLLRPALQVEGGDETPLFVHQVDESGVVHGVAAPVEGHLLRIDPVSSEHVGHSGRLAR